MLVKRAVTCLNCGCGRSFGRGPVSSRNNAATICSGVHVGVDRVHRCQGCHAAIARPFEFVERRHPLRIRFDQRHARAIGRENQ